MPISRPLHSLSSIRLAVIHAFPPATLMTVLWWAFTDGHRESWAIGIPVILLATGTSLLLRSHELWKWRLAGLIRFFPLFLWISWRAGFEVALPAFHPRCPLAPGILIYPLRLPAGPARILFTNTASLSPGTFSADLKGEHLTIHVLDVRRPTLQDLQTLESMIAQLFGIQLSGASPPQEATYE